MRPHRALVAVLALAALTGAAPRARAANDDPKPAPVDQGARYRRLMAEAWGPESPENLEKFLACREALKPVYEQYPDGITQWALREAATRPVLAQSILGILQLRKALDAELEKTGLTDDDYLRMTILVYGRWLRAVREAPPPEASVLRTLQEFDVGLSRRLANNPPEDPRERTRLEERLAAVRWHARYIAPYVLADKADVLAKLDRRTVAWLEEHRARVERLDFGVFDTAPPPRPAAAPGHDRVATPAAS